MNATIANVFFGLSGAFAIATVGVAAATRWRAAPVRPPKKSISFLPPMPALAPHLAAAASEGQQ